MSELYLERSAWLLRRKDSEYPRIRLYCDNCSRTIYETVNPSQIRSKGWPHCCGSRMRLEQLASQRMIDE